MSGSTDYSSDGSDSDVIGPLPPSNLAESVESDSEDNEEKDEEYRCTLLHRSILELQHGLKPVSALGLDPNGSRMVTGGYDYQVALWDFAGMDATFRASYISHCNKTEFFLLCQKIIFCLQNNEKLNTILFCLCFGV